MNDAIQSLTLRLETLEAANRQLSRRLRFVVAAGLLGIVGMVTFSSRTVTAEDDKVHDLVKAHTFAAVDEDGNVRAIVSGEKGKVGIVLMDHAGKVRVGIVEKHEVAAIVCNDQQEKTKVVIGVNEGAGGIEIDDKEGNAVFKKPN